MLTSHYYTLYVISLASYEKFASLAETRLAQNNSNYSNMHTHTFNYNSYLDLNNLSEFTYLK